MSDEVLPHGLALWRSFGTSWFNFHGMLLYCPVENRLFKTSLKEEIKDCILSGSSTDTESPHERREAVAVIPTSPYWLLKQNLDVTIFAETLSICTAVESWNHCHFFASEQT